MPPQPVQVLVEIATKTGVRAELIGAIDVAAFDKFFPALGPDHFAEHLLHFRMGQGLFPDFLNVAMQTHFGRLPFLHVKIGSFGLDDDIEIIIDHDALVSFLGHSSILKALAGDADDFLRRSQLETFRLSRNKTSARP